MLKINSTFEDSALFAFGLEKGSHEFYTKAAEMVDDPQSREFFEAMADLELGHMGYVRMVYCGMDNEACPTSIDDFIKSVQGSYTMSGKTIERALKDIDVAFLDRSDAISIAVRHLNEAYQLYTKAARKVEDQHASWLFKSLAEHNRSHSKGLSRLIEPIED